MSSKVQKAIEDITFRSKKFPEEEFRIICEEKESAIPYLRAAIEKAVLEKDDLDEDYQLHFYAIFLLGQFQDRECFPLIMELLSLPEEVVDELLGDAVTTGVPDILYNTYNGDLELLKNSIKNPNIDDFVRNGMIKVMGQLYLDGDLKKEDWQNFIRQIVYEEDEIGEYIYMELATAICSCRFVEMLPEIRHLYKDNRIDASTIGTYEDCVDMMFDYRDSDGCKTPIYAADMLRGWAMFESTPQKRTDKIDMEQLYRSVKAEFDRQEPKVKIGRNDPCPCGSGKKYKKCCLNKPRSQADLIESEQERQKWLRDYPVAASKREEGRIYLEDFFDSESIEIDKLLYLALKYRPHPVWKPEAEETIENRKRVYLSEAFSRFAEKTGKENIGTFQQYNETYAIHYQCEEWLPALLELLKNKDKELYKMVSNYCNKMKG